MRQNLGTQDCHYVLELILTYSSGFIRVGHVKQVVTDFTGGRLVNCGNFDVTKKIERIQSVSAMECSRRIGKIVIVTVEKL